MKEEKKTGSGKGSLILTFVLAAVITFAGLYHFNVQELFMRHEEQLPNIGEVAHREVEAAGPKPVSSEAEDPGVAGEQEPINEVYSVIALTLDLLAEPEYTAESIRLLSGGTQVTVLDDTGPFLYCELKDGTRGYLDAEKVAPGYWFAKYPGAVDLREIFPNAEFDILFASSRNITGHAMYPAIPLMEESTAAKLSEAYARFQDDGYYLKVYDAYRPKSAQYELFDIVQNNKFIANPNNGNSWHQRGRAIDMSLVRIDDGIEVETPTPIHTFDDASARYSSGNWSEAAKANVDYMTEVMTACDFTTLSTEWWHYEYRGPGVDMENNIDYSTITFERAR